MTGNDQDDDIDWDNEFSDDPEWQAMTHEQRRSLLDFVERSIEKKIFCIYGDEDDDVPDSDWPCQKYLQQCHAKCCSFVFALTKEEAELGAIQYNDKRPFFIDHAEDGYCVHLDRETRKCKEYDNRPLRCRRYDCRNDCDIWPDGVPG